MVSTRAKKVTTQTLLKMKQAGEKIAMLTSYDYSLARLVDGAGIDVILVGDSASNVMAGNETTVPITLDQMIYHAQCVVNGVDRALVVVDMPFGSYQGDTKTALDSAIRIMKESGGHAVKLEGGSEVCDSVQRIVNAGIPVMGHLGLTPQSIYKFGTYTVRAKEDAEATRLMEDAKALEEAKVFMGKLAQIGGTHMAAPPTGKVGDVKLLDAAERYRDLLVASENFPVIPAVEVWGFQNNLYRLGQSVLVALEAQHPRACVLPDVYHLYKGGSGLSGIKHLNGSLIGGFHLNDYPDIPREDIKDRDRVHPGLGVAPLGQFFKDLWSTGYRGALSIELFNPEYWKQDPLKVAKTSLDRTKAIMKKALG